MKVGVHPKVSELMQELSNAIPPQPQYSFMWEIQTILNFIKEKISKKIIRR